jgi:hypothetical protein
MIFSQVDIEFHSMTLSDTQFSHNEYECIFTQTCTLKFFDREVPMVDAVTQPTDRLFHRFFVQLC